MATFKLEILTPEKKFFDGQVESVTCRTQVGELGILSGHRPMVATLEIGEIRLKIDGNWRSAFCSDGVLMVRPDETVVFAQSCEWPEEIDAARAERARQSAEEKLRHKGSISEQKINQISLVRALMRLKIKKPGKYL